jgi:late competence protein required for DNA uptake (superfamily II DNA/RNA helicase)
VIVPAMIVHVDESPVGSGKTERAIRQVVGVPARWLIAVEKIDGVAELADRIREAARGTITLQEIASTGPRRGSSVRQEVEAMPGSVRARGVISRCR